MRFTPERIQKSLLRRWFRRSIRIGTQGKRGLEIGGPSDLFAAEHPNLIFPPVYPLAAVIDNCNFASHTVWSSIADGDPYKYAADKAPGRQFIRDAISLDGIPSGSYDFLLASHILEHVANPMRALREWRRVLKKNGRFLILVPDRRHTFDHRRPDTTLEHLLEDDKRGTDESDMTHLEEILALHDLQMDIPAGTPEQFRARSLENLGNRCLHHHVFNPEVLRGLLAAAGFRTRYLRSDLAPHIIAFGQSRGG